jgi:hypothetical protein
VNLNKTAVIVFGCLSARYNEFKLGDNILDFSDTYHYLGLNFQIQCLFFMLANTLLSRQKQNAIINFLLKPAGGKEHYSMTESAQFMT